MQKIKKMHKLLFALLIGFYTSLHAQQTELKTDSIFTKPRKNVVRAEFLGKSALFGFLYERKVIDKKLDAYASLGTGFGMTNKPFPYPSMVNLSFYATKDDWIISPILGLSIVTYMEYSPYPKTFAERMDYKLHNSYGAAPVSSPISFWLTPYTGVSVNIHKRWNIQITYALLMEYDFFIYRFYNSLSAPGVNVGFKF